MSADKDRNFAFELILIWLTNIVPLQLLTSDHSPIYARLILAQNRPDSAIVSQQQAITMPYPPVS